MSNPSRHPWMASRENNIDFLRFALACVVIHTHSYEMTGRHYAGMANRLLHLELGGAWLAVNAFFALSGVLITASWLKSTSTTDYFRRRLLRIYPGFVAAILFCVLIVGPLGGATLATYFRDTETYAFFKPLIFGPIGTLPGVFETLHWKGQVNSSLWTIRFELFCYVLLAVLGLTTLLRHRAAILSLFLLSLIAQIAQTAAWPGRWEMVLPFFGDVWEVIRFIVFFLAGATFYLYRDVIPFDRRLFAAAAIVLVAAFALKLSIIALPICGVYCLMYVAFHPTLRLPNCGKYGDFSYGMYLYAFPIQQLLVLYFRPAQNPLILSLVGAVLTLAVAFLSWHLIEKPALALKGRRTSKALPVEPQSPETTKTAPALGPP
jgi:peptidoglycan/LPS O-acetylase OafA/YrhL